MATISGVRDAIVTALQTITGLQVFDWPTPAGKPPFAVVGLDNVEYETTFSGGSWHAQYTVRLLVARADEQSAVAALDPYIAQSGSSSVFLVISNNETLSGACDTAAVNSAQGYGVYGYASGDLLGIEFTVDVYAR